MANLQKPPDTMKTELCTVMFAEIHFRVQRQIVELESRYITLSVSRDLSTGINCH